MNEPNKNRPSRTDWARVDAMTDEEIDTSDIPPLTDEFFKNATLRMPRKPATTTNRHDEKSDELRPEYDFDFSKSRPNRFANRVKEERVRVNLESDHKKKTRKGSDKTERERRKEKQSGRQC